MQSIDSIQGFRPKKYIDGRSWTSRVVPILIGNSQTLKIGSRVKWVAAEGVHNADAVADKTAFYVVGFTTRQRIPMINAVSGTHYNGTYTVSDTGDTYAAEADNITVDKVYALCVPADGLIVSAKLDAASGTTTGSDLPGHYLDIETTAGNRSTLLDESTATTSIANFITVPAEGREESCIDPEAPATGDRRVLVMAQEKQLEGDGVAESA
jgi:hypothetical protein